MSIHNFFKKWSTYVLEGSVDSKEVAKIILYNKKGHVLFLKRTEYVEKFKNKWDLPGGHAHIGEDLLTALEREVKEETGLTFSDPKKIKKIDNITFYKAKYNKGDIKLSEEHSEFLFRNVKKIKNPSKFENVAKLAIEND